MAATYVGNKYLLNNFIIVDPEWFMPFYLSKLWKGIPDEIQHLSGHFG